MTGVDGGWKALVSLSGDEAGPVIRLVTEFNKYPLLCSECGERSPNNVGDLCKMDL